MDCGASRKFLVNYLNPVSNQNTDIEMLVTLRPNDNALEKVQEVFDSRVADMMYINSIEEVE